MNPVYDLIAGLVSPVTEFIKGWQERKRAKLESELAVHAAVTQAKIQRLATAQEADIAWENLSIGNSGWKDEWFTIILSIPAILCFIPGLADVVYRGFDALKNCPDWYQWGLMIAIGSSFGYRKIADFMSLKKGA